MVGRNALRGVGFLLVAALVPACGSTVQVKPGTGADAAGALGGQNGLGALPGTAGGGTGVAGTTGALGGTAGGATGGTAGGTTAGTGGRGSAGTGAAGGTGGGVGSTGGSGGNAQGITPTQVYVGFIYDKNAGAVNQAAGIGAISSGNARANTNAIVNDINAHGGLGGRKLVPVWGNVDSESTQTLDQQYAALCQTFTQDNPRVFAVDEAGNDSYKACLTKAGVLMLSSDLPTIGAQELRQWPGLIEQGYPNLDRLASYFLTPLVNRKYFTPWDSLNGKPAATGAVKVGILTYDSPVFRRTVDTILVPGLKQLGYDAVVARIAPLTRAADVSSEAAAVKSAQLTFASNGVTHVIMFESNGGLSTLFMPTARSQSYYPRYGVNSASAAEALIESGAVDPKQYNGAVGVGWLPNVDLPSNLNPDNGPYSNANRRHCIAVMKANGITFTSGNAELIALNACAGLYLLKTVLDLRPARITVGSTVGAIESLGTSYQKAGGLGQTFSPGRQDPLDKGYDMAYDSGCSCMHYVGPLLTIP